MAKSKVRTPLTPGGELDAVAKGTGAGTNWILQLAQVAPNLPQGIIDELIDAGERGIPLAKKVMLKKLQDMDRGDAEARAKIRYGEVAKPVVDLALMLSTVLGTRKAQGTLTADQLLKAQSDYEKLQEAIQNLDRLEMVETERLTALAAEKGGVVEAEVVDAP